jgi:hypothetical protein
MSQESSFLEQFRPKKSFFSILPCFSRTTSYICSPKINPC